VAVRVPTVLLILGTCSASSHSPAPGHTDAHHGGYFANSEHTHVTSLPSESRPVLLGYSPGPLVTLLDNCYVIFLGKMHPFSFLPLPRVDRGETS
jgi:hypothetical protein